jgi:L-2-hydroxyglutarate oxidase LhgO
MMCLLGDLENAPGGTLALTTAVQGIRPLDSGGGLPGSAGWEITVKDTELGDESTVTADTIVNSAGLASADIYNMIVPDGQRMQMYYAKGNYFSYSGPNISVETLIYPAPEPGLGGLGTHLTLDMGGRLRFGPDVEWIDTPDDLAVNAARLPEAIVEIKKYLPGIDEAHLRPDYAGVRPKLDKTGTFKDFVVRREEGYSGWINLLGIESPGLTSSLAIADMVRRLLYS